MAPMKMPTTPMMAAVTFGDFKLSAEKMTVDRKSMQPLQGEVGLGGGDRVQVRSLAIRSRMAIVKSAGASCGTLWPMPGRIRRS